METTSEALDASTAFTPRTGFLARLQHILHRYPTLSPASVLLFATIVFAFTTQGKILNPNTLGIILQQTSVMAVLAIGQTLIVLTAGVDLGVGTGMLLTHLVMAKLFADQGVPAIFAMMIGLMIGLLLGAFHGWLVTRVSLPPFIVTLGTFYIFQSLGLVYSKAQTTSSGDLGAGPKDKPGVGSLLLWPGRQIKIGTFTITYNVILVILMYLVFAYILSNTKWGSHVYSTGDDKEAARLAGINVNRVLLSVYMVAGALYALGGWVQLGRSLTASSNGAADVNLETITAVVIGGTSLFGGRGRLSGTLVGALVVTVFRIGLKLSEFNIGETVIKVNPLLQNFAIGSLIITAVALDQWIRRVAK